MPSPTCHFAWNCCRGCSHRRLEPPSVCARGCARGCMRSCWRCSSLTGPGATAPSPNKSRSPSPLSALRAPPSRLPPPPTPASLLPRLPASQPLRLPGARSLPLRRAGVSEGSSTKLRAVPALSTCLPARRGVAVAPGPSASR
ncbi:hypothetical protein HJG60_008224 [Phyllostomus discolor]|uniref:Uncharacterized protein n=1 Tax=Phyllostomus discolor TaxID=89673 RepID=A0A833Z1H6_9CHIR|nr:hypothetical protein HJG60_008224 [Phyllostomus discolor]